MKSSKLTASAIILSSLTLTLFFQNCGGNFSALQLQGALDNDGGRLDDTLPDPPADLPDEVEPTPNPTPENIVAQGSSLYIRNCASCHGELPNSVKLNKTSSQISGAILNVQMMSDIASLRSLSSTDIEAIQQALVTNPVPAGATPTLLSQGYTWTEGPSYSSEGFLLFTDQSVNRVYKVFENPTRSEVFMENADRLNGTEYTADGRLIAARGGNGRNLVAIDQHGRETVLASKYNGKRFNGPNDVAILHDGSVFFTDPIYGAPVGGEELGMRGVYHVATDGTVTLVGSFGNPNGIVLSPDHSRLYVADDGDKIVYVYDVARNGVTSNRRVFFTVPTNVSGSSGNDGMTVDAAGNIYVTCRDRIWIVKPSGTLITNILVNNVLTNVAFGGPGMKTLYITSGTRVSSIPMLISGLR